MAIQNSTLQAINNLVENVRDGEKGYKAAADSVDNPQIKSELNRFAQQRTEFRSELEKCVKQFGSPTQQPSGFSSTTTGSTSGSNLGSTTGSTTGSITGSNLGSTSGSNAPSSGSMSGSSGSSGLSGSSGSKSGAGFTSSSTSPTNSGSNTNRGWVNLNSAISSHDNKAILSECEKSDAQTLRSYENVMNSPELPSDVKNVIKKQHDEIEAAKTAVSSLKNTIM